MERVYERCCALDVHKEQVTACVHVPNQAGERAELGAEFGTMTADLLGLCDWLKGLGVTHVAMEATGVYWKPVYYLLEDDFELLLVNAQHVKNVPGRKTDVQDAQWLCQLLEHGLLKSSFVPPRPIRELRDLTRYRKALTWERGREANRLQKVLEDANIKLASVASRPLGASGRAMLRALCEGESDPQALADLARGKLRKKLPALRVALEGRFRAHHALLASQLLAHIEYLDETIEQLTAEIEERTNSKREWSVTIRAPGSIRNPLLTISSGSRRPRLTGGQSGAAASASSSSSAPGRRNSRTGRSALRLGRLRPAVRGNRRRGRGQPAHGASRRRRAHPPTPADSRARRHRRLKAHASGAGSEVCQPHLRPSGERITDRAPTRVPARREATRSRPDAGPDPPTRRRTRHAR